MKLTKKKSEISYIGEICIFFDARMSKNFQESSGEAEILAIRPYKICTIYLMEFAHYNCLKQWVD